MPLRKPQQYFKDVEREEAEAAEARRLEEAAAVRPKRVRSPKEIIESDLPAPKFQPRRRPEPQREQAIRKTIAETLSDRIDSLAVGMPDNDKLWDRLSGIENSITTLQFDKLDRESVLKLFEVVSELENTLGSLQYDKESHRRLTEEYTRTQEYINRSSEETEASIREVNDRLIESNTSITKLREMVESVVVRSTDENRESIEAVKAIQVDLANAIDRLPQEQFDPSDIISSISSLRTSLTKDIKENREKANAALDASVYEDDLDNLQNLISEVRSSIKYYDTDVESLKMELLDLGNHLSKTITEKVTKLNADQKKANKNIRETLKRGEKRMEQTLIKYGEEIPEVKYYDDEIDVIEGKINNILTTIKELPEVKYYDEEVVLLRESIQKLNTKVESINVKDWTNIIESIQKDVSEMQKLNEEVDPYSPDALKNYVTFDKMQEHYRGFINRIQTQLDSLGGGGAVNILDQDDLDIDVRRNPQNYNDKFLRLKYDPTTKITKFTAETETIIDNINDLGGLDLSAAEDGYIMVYIAATGLWEARPVQYIGVNIDANPDKEIQDYGDYGFGS